MLILLLGKADICGYFCSPMKQTKLSKQSNIKRSPVRVASSLAKYDAKLN
jgi:hypothetical protein